MASNDATQLRELRDILIELKTEFRDFREYSREKFEMFQTNKAETADINTRLVSVEGSCDDFEKMKNKVNNVIISLLGEALAVIAVLVYLAKDLIFA